MIKYLLYFYLLCPYICIYSSEQFLSFNRKTNGWRESLFLMHIFRPSQNVSFVFRSCAALYVALTPASCQRDELWLRACDGCPHRVVMQVSGACADWGWPSDCSSSVQTEVTALQACPDRTLNFFLSSPGLCCHDNEYKSIIQLCAIVPQCIAQNCRSFVSEQHSLLKCFQSSFQELFLCSAQFKEWPVFCLSYAFMWCSVTMKPCYECLLFSGFTLTAC